MKPDAALAEAIEITGWNDASVGIILLRFIESQKLDNAFEEFLRTAVDDEMGIEEGESE